MQIDLRLQWVQASCLLEFGDRLGMPVEVAQRYAEPEPDGKGGGREFSCTHRRRE